MSAFNQYNRTTDQTFNKGDSRVLRLSNTNDVTFGFGGGKYLATFRLAFTGLAPGEDFRVTPYYVDTDHAGKTVGNPHLFPTVGVPGTFGATWGQVVFDYDVPAPKSGLTRRLRLRGDYAGAKPVTVTSINTTVRKAALA